MPLPVAHGLLGASVAAALDESSESRRWKPLLTGAFLGICPDFDYALNWLRISGGGWHHGFTHSILFAFFLGLLTATVLGGRLRSIVVFCCATVSHTSLDFLMTESSGVALLWPFTDHRYKLSVPNPINYTWENSSLWGSAIDLLRISLIELMIFAPIFLVVVFVRRLLVERGKAAPETS
jgi:membrane-bound metal-dependent hydrolase YbcI (DUF457 family)